MRWLTDHWGEFWALVGRHAYLAGVPLLIGLAIALPLGWLAWRYRAAYPPIVVGSGLLYTIPSLALFVLLPGILGTGILDPVNVIAAMTIYTVALLSRTVADALAAVPPEVRLAATAVGLGGLRRFLTVELPLATPVIAAGLRVAAVSNVSLVSVATLIGVPQLGMLFIDGFQRDYADPLVVGVVGCVLLALAFDVAILTATWLATPWLRTTR